MCIFFFKQKTAYEMRISDWSSDVCSSDLTDCAGGPDRPDDERQRFRHQLEGALCHQPAGRPFQLAQPRRRTVGQPEDLDVRLPVFPQALRSEERRGRKECVSTCRSRWSRYHEKKTMTIMRIILYKN